jgi:rRNA processing protein Krr1/Pno1
VIVGRGIEADKAVTYVREELMLKVITLVDEEKDVKRLTEVLVLKGGQ